MWKRQWMLKLHDCLKQIYLGLVSGVQCMLNGVMTAKAVLVSGCIGGLSYRSTRLWKSQISKLHVCLLLWVTVITKILLLVNVTVLGCLNWKTGFRFCWWQLHHLSWINRSCKFTYTSSFLCVIVRVMVPRLDFVSQSVAVCIFIKTGLC